LFYWLDLPPFCPLRQIAFKEKHFDFSKVRDLEWIVLPKCNYYNGLTVPMKLGTHIPAAIVVDAHVAADRTCASGKFITHPENGRGAARGS
jgi:hypothetical protein